MSFDDEDSANLPLPLNFSGNVRLFPLPGLVLFPGVVQALHIFEPRYRKMMEDALAGDQTIAMCLPKTAGESQVPEIHEVICIGKIVAHAELDDGRYNLLLQGVSRAKIVREIGVEQPYRMAEVTILPDIDDVDMETECEFRERLQAHCEGLQSQDVVKAGLESSVLSDSGVWDDFPVGLLVDLVCFSLPISSDQRQKILETQEVSARAELLLDFAEALTLRKDPASKVDFPPDFSSN